MSRPLAHSPARSPTSSSDGKRISFSRDYEVVHRKCRGADTDFMLLITGPSISISEYCHESQLAPVTRSAQASGADVG